MLHLKSILRLLCVTLATLALLAPGFTTPTTAVADAGHLTTATTITAAADNNDDKDSDDDDSESRRDPCRKALKRAAKGKPLPPECEPGGSSSGIAKGDFNGDGFGDLAIGVPGEDIEGAANAGAVNVIYGSADGLSAAGDQFWHQDSLGVLDKAENGENERFGSALASGDFNGDNFSDLAIGVPGEDLGSIVDAGAVHVLYGTDAGLSAAGNQFWSQDSTGISNTAESDDRFGRSLAWGDYNHDGIGDLAIGVSEDLGSVVDAGAVHVLYGTGAGLSAFGNQFWSQDSTGILDTAEAFDEFGLALAAGDFDGDSFSDLAIGVHGEHVGIFSDAGAVNVIYGTAAGLSGADNQFWSQSSFGIPGTADEGDRFGSALAAGDFNGSGRSDLAIGVPGKDWEGTIAEAGAVIVIYGTAEGLSALNSQSWHQESPDVPESAQPFDRFGSALAAGDFNGDGRRDLAIGVPFEDSPEFRTDVGVVIVIYGSVGGLDPSPDQFSNIPPARAFAQGFSGLDDFGVFGDFFGRTLTAWDFNDNGRSDLAIGVPGKRVNGVDAGAVHVLYGGAFTVGLSGPGQVWTQDTPGILDEAERDDLFGLGLY